MCSLGLFIMLVVYIYSVATNSRVALKTLYSKRIRYRGRRWFWGILLVPKLCWELIESIKVKCTLLNRKGYPKCPRHGMWINCRAQKLESRICSRQYPKIVNTFVLIIFNKFLQASNVLDEREFMKLLKHLTKSFDFCEFTTCSNILLNQKGNFKMVAEKNFAGSSLEDEQMVYKNGFFQAL